ncbi:Ku protein [Pseudopedobacter saltans DSM 12145]|uniref:Non-homologous end joining protein Ku n=1 Tax=Pseudopedobacter saltans (strain ATCC 51119 / DSM 12145 / JCM 21818 / CCUG 39354 / LMG 10337 / NBRC 100064 / NCIMB 13643) TaxID=762903 RepID=F0SBI3_PSESL|nr:Ku protein [Pseudopedobacter saltans]ADY51629.1 Ku protein [Pseudopedobacter saltans DSM 12145]
MKSIWNGTIAFGLVNIPIKLYSAIENSSLDLDMLDSRDLSRIKFLRINEKSRKEVPYEKIVKGYLYNDNYIVLDEHDFEEASPEKTRTIDIQNFVKISEVNPMLFETSYYAQADKQGAKAYNLLLSALKKTKMAGLAQFVLRQKEHLCLLYEQNNVIVVSRIRFAEEIRNPSEIINTEEKSVSKKELDVALALINQYTGPFDIKSYKDTYSSELLKIINAKAKGKRPTIKKLKIRKAKSEDLYEQLLESLNKKGA